MTKKTKKNRRQKRQKRQKTRHFKRKLKRKISKTRRKRGGVRSLEDYSIMIPNIILRRLKYLQEEGQQTRFQQYGEDMIGNERGGHFCYTIDSAASQIVITGYNLAPIIPNCTSCNTGDYPFTFHTHPVVLFADTKEVDNIPNLISDEDLKSIIVDSIWNVIGTKSDRKICGEESSQTTTFWGNTSGVNIFDILAVPCGIYIYGLDPTKQPYPIETDIEGEEEEKGEQLVTPSKNRNDKDSYTNCPKIKRYQKKLERLGFFLFYKSWTDIERGDDMSIPIKFITRNRHLSTPKCGASRECSDFSV